MKTKPSTINLLFSGTIILALAILASCDSQNANSTTADMPQQDKKIDSEFAVKAAEGGIYEVEMGTLAQMKGASTDIKDLGKMMADQHSKANEELKSLAAKKNINLPTSMGAENQAKFDSLSVMKGADFDTRYAKIMVADHETDIRMFRQEADKGDDKDLKDWASGKIPVLEHHLYTARNAHNTLTKKIILN